MKKNEFQFRRANEEDLPEICRMVKLAGEIVPVKEWFEAENEGLLPSDTASAYFLRFLLPDRLQRS